MEKWRTYDRVADLYERVHAPRMAEVARDLVAAAAPHEGARVLDVGTGTGVFGEAAAEAVGPSGLVVGVDVSIPMLAVGKRTRSSTHLAGGSAVDLPFADATFDAVLAGFVVSHFKRYQTGLFDMLRVLRPGGTFAMSSWADKPDDLQRTWNELVESTVGKGLLADARKQTVPWADRFADRYALGETLNDAGLKQIRIERREYKFVYELDEFVEGLGAWSTGRFIHSMLGDKGWQRFLARAHDVFADRFADPVNDFREVWVSTAVKPEP